MASRNMITILLADDHAVMRAGLRLLLERHADLRVVGEAGNGRDAVELAASLKPDVVVMDIAMQTLNGIEATQRVCSSGTATQVVILSMHSDESYVLRALKAGARAYILKDSAEEDLIAAVRSVHAGKSFFSPAISRLLLDDYVRQVSSKGVEDSYDLLSSREKELLQLIAEGKTNKEIASLLNISHFTVETHRANILQKLNLHSVQELILYAVRKGIIS